jgi:hypothetical protein
VGHPRHEQVGLVCRALRFLVVAVLLLPVPSLFARPGPQAPSDAKAKPAEKAGAKELTPREKRMLHWTLLFNTKDASEYLSQLRSLGAILVVPVKEKGDTAKYQVIRDLTAKPAKLLDEDVEKLQRIYWIDDRKESVRDIMAELGLNIRPSHFAALFPEKLENQLIELEKKAAGGKPEDQIKETKFRVKKVADGYRVDLEKITFH